MTARSHCVRGAATLLLAGAVAGCAYDQGGFKTATLNKEVPVTNAFIMPPPGGPQPIAVLENRYENGLAQDILLRNRSGSRGQNAIIVRAFGPMGRDRGQGRLSTDIPSVTTIRKEMRERLPGVHMEISGLYVQNRYGPFSYAVGRSRSAGNCIYAWQRISAEAKVFSAQRGAITWRLRLCDTKTSARDLLLVAYGMTINGYFLSRSWNPYGDPPPLDDRVGTPGATILPEQAVDRTVIAPNSYGEARRERIRAPSRSRPRPAAPPRPTVLNDPVPGSAVVPRPENTDLNDPRVEDSNLPRAGSAATRFDVPTPPSQRGVISPTPAPTRTVPSVAPPPATGTGVTLPRRTDARLPSVRVVEVVEN
ncbi:MAG: cellulose biosynthesis protein BcsN [Pseudomonadota bacterium]